MNWKKYSSMLLLCLAYAVFLLPLHSIAKTDVVYASYKYVMGDNDTKNDAKRICFIEAKRRCLEKVGTYIESETEVKDYSLTKDEIRTHVAALTKVEVVKEKIKFEGESIAVFMTVKAEVDMNSVNRQLVKIRKDDSLQRKIREQNIRLKELERKYNNLQKQLDIADPSKVPVLRQDRETILDEIENIEKRYKHVKPIIKERQLRESQTAKNRVELVREILTYIELGMTSEEVEYVLGPSDKMPNIESNYDISRLGGDVYHCEDRLFYDRISIDISKNDTVVGIRYITSMGFAVSLKTSSYNIMNEGIYYHPLNVMLRKYPNLSGRDKYFNNKSLAEIRKYVLGEE